MNPIKRGQLQKEMAQVTVEFLDTGKILMLEEKGDSVCHFLPKFCVNKKEEVQLRIDWSDLDENNNFYPVLDADFYDKKTGKKLKTRSLSTAQKGAHHTKPIHGKGRFYEWIYKDGERILPPFKVAVTWRTTVSVSAGVQITTIVDVIKGNSTKDH